MVELIELFKSSLVATLTKFLLAFLEDKLLREQGAVAANPTIDIKYQLCEGRG